MRNQEELIHEGDWDVLIILDACRYDFFEEEYAKYLNGELKEVKSPASDTPTWLLETFPDYYRLRYISANPFVNSYGLSLKEKLREGLVVEKMRDDWYGGNTFREVIDAWDWAWSEELGLIDPFKIAQNYEFSGGREIIHFAQPHAPYVGIPLHNRESTDDDEDENTRLWSFFESNFFAKWFGKNIIVKGLSKIMSWQKVLKLQELVGRDLEPLQQTIKLIGADKMPDIYRANLTFVLRVVSYLVNEVFDDEKVVVSSDHGELLGMKEPHLWGHSPYKNDRVLKCVPWLEVEL